MKEKDLEISKTKQMEIELKTRIQQLQKKLSNVEAQLS